jgi:hypothetical protein
MGEPRGSERRSSSRSDFDLIGSAVPVVAAFRAIVDTFAVVLAGIFAVKFQEISLIEKAPFPGLFP